MHNIPEIQQFQTIFTYLEWFSIPANIQTMSLPTFFCKGKDRYIIIINIKLRYFFKDANLKCIAIIIKPRLTIILSTSTGITIQNEFTLTNGHAS